MKIYKIIFLLLFFPLHCSVQNYSYIPYSKSEYSVSQKEWEFLDTLQYRSFLYFLNEMNPGNGLIKDRTAGYSPASTAAVGFGLAVYAIGAEREWITREYASDKTLKILDFYFNSEQSTNTDATGYKGFYYHFLKMDSGKREWNCELSSIDTGWLLAGIIFSKHYYNLDNEKENKIRDLSEKIINRIDWNFYLVNNEKYPNTLSLGWYPEKGLSPVGWVGYNESLIIYILSAGCGWNGAVEAYKTWLSYYDWRKPYNDFELLSFPPLFGHQYSHMFIDFRGIADEYMADKGLDYFENSRRAVYVQQRYAVENPLKWEGYDSLTWGLSACDGPGPDYNYNDKKFEYYTARGTSGPDLIQNDDGTIAPTAAAGSIIFAPEIVIPTLIKMYEEYGNKGLWGKYGFVDAFNPTLNWYGKDYLGIDQGPIIIMIENFRNDFVWKYTMKDPIIQKGLQILGFKELQ